MEHLLEYNEFKDSLNEKATSKSIEAFIDKINDGRSAEEIASEVAKKFKAKDKYEDILDVILNPEDEDEIGAELEVIINENEDNSFDINELPQSIKDYVEKDNGRKKLLHNNKSSRAAKMFLTKNANKILNQPGIRAVGSMRKSDWERDEAQYAENIKKKGMRTVTKKQWDRTHRDYKGMIKGQPYMMWFDKKTQSTVYGPVKIKESVNEFDLNEKKYKTTATKSELKTAYELGVKAFNRGIKRAPMLDKNLMRMLKGKEVADTSSNDIMDSWLKGWDTTNLKAPVGESVTEGRAFVAAAKKAKDEGKTEFEFKGKTYPVTIKEVLRKRNRKLR